MYFFLQTLLNGQLEFYFAGPEDANRVFGITPDTGSIYPRISLRDVTQDQWTFTVGVRDKGIPPLFVETSVTANIQRIGKPTFGSTRYDITEFENAPVDKFLTQVLATDPMPGVSVPHKNCKNRFCDLRNTRSIRLKQGRIYKYILIFMF